MVLLLSISFQDLKKQNMKLSSESASLVSELALATSVLEAIGLLPKEEAEDVTTPLGKVLEVNRPMKMTHGSSHTLMYVLSE